MAMLQFRNPAGKPGALALFSRKDSEPTRGLCVV
jgi:hypothetical protein